MNRRGFLQSMLALGVAPYVITNAGVLMPVRKIATPTLDELLPGIYSIIQSYDKGDGHVYREEWTKRSGTIIRVACIDGKVISVGPQKYCPYVPSRLYGTPHLLQRLPHAAPDLRRRRLHEAI